MQDTDSLLVFRLQKLRNQPKTMRGKCIVCFAHMNGRPKQRILLASLFILFILLHTVGFCLEIIFCFMVSPKYFSKETRYT